LADSAPLVASFLHQCYLLPNVRTLSRPEILSRLEDALFAVREVAGPESYPREAADYLEEWASDERGWLRKYYPLDSDLPHYDITPATEKALEWLSSLEERAFIGTSSRLLTIVEILRQMAEGSETDPEARVRELERRKADIEAEIGRVREGRLDLLDETELRERFLQVEATARGLLSDFRAVEQNFRQLDREVREKVATWEGSKGELLAEVFGERDAISDSDQGRSFRAFWDFLMSASRQDELTRLLEKVFSLEAVERLRPDRRLLRIHYDWLEAGEVAQRTVARLSEQLRRFLDEAVWIENRRIMEIVRSIEQKALALRGRMGERTLALLEDSRLDLRLPLERPLHRPPVRTRIRDLPLLPGEGEVSTDLLFSQIFVDRGRLERQLDRLLAQRSPLSLGEVLEIFPLTRGLSELVVYLVIASERPETVADEGREEVLAWEDGEGVRREARLARILFYRR
jgi:flagellar motility protein MotE (MotC chaperone)